MKNTCSGWISFFLWHRRSLHFFDWFNNVICRHNYKREGIIQQEVGWLAIKCLYAPFSGTLDVLSDGTSTLSVTGFVCSDGLLALMILSVNIQQWIKKACVQCNQQELIPINFSASFSANQKYPINHISTCQMFDFINIMGQLRSILISRMSVGVWLLSSLKGNIPILFSTLYQRCYYQTTDKHSRSSLAGVHNDRECEL